MTADEAPDVPTEPAPGDPVHREVVHHVDPVVLDAVHGIRDRFGAVGLRDLLTLATYELGIAEQAAEELRRLAEADETEGGSWADGSGLGSDARG